MVSAEREPIMGVWGRGPGAEPLVGGQGGEAENFSRFWSLKEAIFDNKFTIFATFVTRKNGLNFKSCV